MTENNGQAETAPVTRELLVALRDRAAAQIASGRTAAADITAAVRDGNVDDEHDPEGATLAFERAQTEAVVDNAGRALAEAQAALARWDAGTYGICENCGRPIGLARLAARPTARLCIDCASLAAQS